MEDNPLNYSCCERTENSRLENYKMTLGVQETYRLLPRRRRRPLGNNAARERSRVKTLRSAFLDLQRSLPSVPPDTKLSKLDVLVLATTYIAHLMRTLRENGDESKALAPNGGMHPVKKWPMRARLYAGILSSTDPSGPQEATDESQEPEFAPMSSSCSWSPAIETYFR